MKTLPDNAIPFDWDKYQSGTFTAVYRNGEEVAAVAYLPVNNSEQLPIVSRRNNGDFSTHLMDGSYFRDRSEAVRDLFLVPKPKKVQFWLNYYPKSGDVAIHKSVEAAMIARSFSGSTFGPFEIEVPE